MTKVIDIMPSEIIPPNAIVLADKGGVKGVIANVLPPVREWHPDQFMRSMGYTRNPDICRHVVKGYTPRDGWWCKECGLNL